jgi:sporulation protein YlmC with PRC-barrel domain
MDYSRFFSASSMMKDPVKNHDGDKLGGVKDIVIDHQNGRVAYVVLSYGGFLGMGDKLFAVPIEALEFSIEDKCFYLNVSEEQLEDAPGFDKDNWPSQPDPEFMEEVYTHYGYQPYWK